tara:strand:+ start:298 stop:786 length:489 start_codon:yes stop_codon:yes gene_type:complete
MDSDQLLEIGRIGKPHGLRGELIVALISNVDERMEVGAEVYLTSRQKYVVTGSKPYKSNFLVSLSGITSRTEAEALAGELLLAKPLEDPNIKWAHDLIGNLVIDNEGNPRGLIVEIHANPASDLLVLEDETLIPVVFLKDIKDNKVFVDTPKGIFQDSQSCE